MTYNEQAIVLWGITNWTLGIVEHWIRTRTIISGWYSESAEIIEVV
jgi:hypothetical protein